MPANTPIKWGILSTANIAANAFIPAARRTPGAQVVAVASRDQASAQSFAQAHRIPTALAGYQTLLDDPQIDAVYNPLPNTLHAEWTIKAAQAGKHVFCEKPLAVTAGEAQSMVDACQAAGVLLFEAFVFLHHPQNRRLFDLVRNNAVGRLRHIDAGMTFTVTDRQNIRLIKDLGGGSIYDGGVYPITFSRFIAAAEPHSVQALMRFDPEAGVDLWAALLLEYPDGITSTLYSGFEGGGGPHALITGAEGKIVVPSPYHPAAKSNFQVVRKRPSAAASGGLGAFFGKVLTAARGPESRETFTFKAGAPPFQPAIHFFQECIRGRQTPTYMADYAIGTLKIVEAAFRSAESGQKITL